MVFWKSVICVYCVFLVSELFCCHKSTMNMFIPGIRRVLLPRHSHFQQDPAGWRVLADFLDAPGNLNVVTMWDPQLEEGL